MTRAACLGMALVIALAASSLPARGEEPEALPETTPEVPIKIGMVDTLFRDLPASLALSMMKPFGSVMKAQTGVPGELVMGGDHDNLGRDLADNRVQIAVLNGIEFAWVKLQHPELQPMMVAVNHDPHLRALLIVHSKTDIETFDDLEGKKLALPKGTIEHCRVFLRQNCDDRGQESGKYFEKITKPGTIEDALDDVVDGEVEAALVDAVAFEAYKSRKPGRSNELKVLMESEIFPAAAIVYNPATLDEATLERFRNGLLNAKNLMLGRQLLMMWKLTGFEPVPEDYDATLATIVTFYAPPLPKIAN